MIKNKFCLLFYILLLFAINSLAVPANLYKNKYGVEDRTAENILLWQRSYGGWPKDTYTELNNIGKPAKAPATERKKVTIDYTLEMTPEQRQLALDSKDFIDATIDNGHTIKEIRYLLQAHQKTGKKDYLLAAEKGIVYLFTAQYENGGWPQFYPDKSSYKHQITFNDNAMTNVMHLMKDISLKQKYTDLVNAGFSERAQKAFDQGIDIILKTQLKQKGQLTVWCAQYDEKTLQPEKARSYELPSLSGMESVEIVRVLMRVENPSSRIKEAIAAAINWFESSKITGWKTERIKDPSLPKGIDVVVVPDSTGIMWARFYDLETNLPFFCDRDGFKLKSLAEIGYERRTGYGWYGTTPLKLIRVDYPEWKKKNLL